LRIPDAKLFFTETV